jgi:hypothetical protein
MLEGYDVSHWQTSTPTRGDFLIAKASQGTRPDTAYREHIRNARAAGMVVGAYAFNHDTAIVSVSDQADAFLEAAGDVDLYALDVEGRYSFTRDEARAFIGRVQEAGRSCGLYMSESPYYRDVGQDWRWVANWSREPAIPWDIWQYRGSPLDLDRFDGTRDELVALGGQRMKLMDPQAAAGTVTLLEDWPLRRVRGDVTTPDVPKGTTYPTTTRVKWQPSEDDTPFPAFLVPRGSDQELYVIRASKVRFEPADGPPPEPQSYDVTVGGKSAGAVELP